MWISGGGYRHQNDAPSSQGSGRLAKKRGDGGPCTFGVYTPIGFYNRSFLNQLTVMSPADALLLRNLAFCHKDRFLCIDCIVTA
jgi:hypothetical protein